MAKDLRASLATVGKSLAVAATGMAALGTAAAAGIVAAVKHFSDAGSALNDISGRTGVAASSLAELKFAAEQTGAGIEDVEIALKNMAKKGLDVADFDKVAAEIAAIDDPSERAARALETFGKSGTKLIPMLGELQALRQEARDLGLAPTDEEIARADAMGDSFDKLKAVMSASLFKIGSAFAPIVQAGVDAAVRIVAAFNRWMESNRVVIDTLHALGQALSTDLALAGEIAMTSLQAVLLQGVNGIATLLGNGLGNLFGSIASDLILGDFASAWDTVMKNVAAGWDAVALGMVTVFKSVVEKVVEMWNKTTAAIVGTLVTLEAIFRLQGTAGEVAAARINAARQGIGVAATGIGATLSVGSSALANLEESQRGRAAASAGAFVRKVAGTSSSDALAETLAKLEALRQSAAAGVASKAAQAAIGGGLFGPTQAASAFSAGGAVALGFGSGGPFNKLTSAVEKGSRLEGRMVKLLEEIDRKMKGGGIFR